MITDAAKIHLLDEAISSWMVARELALSRTCRLAAEVVGGWQETQKHLQLRNCEHGAEFNPLSLIPLGEITHSRLIGAFLDPNGSHGQGFRFLHSFLRMLDVPNPEAGIWNVSVESGRVDVMLWRRDPRSTILIENKSNDACDQPNQIYRYWHKQIYLDNPSLVYSDLETQREYQVIYLPVDESKSPSEQSLQRPEDWAALNSAPKVPLTVRTIAFQQLVARWHTDVRGLIPATNTRLIAFFDFYHEYWNT